ncbi:MAG: hypothetical protein Q9221_002457 [Calogaya cf. arnoldii]
MADSLLVRWKQTGSIDSTLGIQCWARSANSEANSRGEQPIFNETIKTIRANELKEGGIENGQKFYLSPDLPAIEMSKYANYSPCVFTLQNSAAGNYTETSSNVFISNVTGVPGTPYGQGMRPNSNSDGSTPTEKPNKFTYGEGVSGASGASMISSSIASVILGLIASTYWLLR